MIWRRFVVPADIPLDHLHDVIQIIMGWQDYHLHEFNIDRTRYTEFFDEIQEEDDSEDDGSFQLDELVKRKGAKFTYIYDFGDGWMHTLALEKTNFVPGPRDEPIMCLEGRGACPPEDVGGVGGYQRFREIMADPTHEEHEDLKTWYGKPFHPDEFDAVKINLELLKYMRVARVRNIPWDPRDGIVG